MTGLYVGEKPAAEQYASPAKPPNGKYIAVLNPKFYTMLRYSTTGSRVCKARRMARRT